MTNEDEEVIEYKEINKKLLTKINDNKKIALYISKLYLIILNYYNSLNLLKIGINYNINKYSITILTFLSFIASIRITNDVKKGKYQNTEINNNKKNILLLSSLFAVYSIYLKNLNIESDLNILLNQITSISLLLYNNLELENIKKDKVYKK